MFNKNYIFLLKFYFFSIFLLIFKTNSFATENHNFTLFEIKLGSNLSTVPNIKFLDPCKEILVDKDMCEFKIVYRANFSPKNKAELIDEYAVLFSPVSKKILDITGTTKKFPNTDKCAEFNINAIKVISERLLNNNKGLGAHKEIYPRDAKFFLKEKNILIKLKSSCILVDVRKPQGPSIGSLSLAFDDNYIKPILIPEIDNLIASKKNEKQKKSIESGKFKNM